MKASEGNIIRLAQRGFAREGDIAKGIDFLTRNIDGLPEEVALELLLGGESAAQAADAAMADIALMFG